MRFLSIYYTHKPGGFCKRLYRLLNGLIAQGDEVEFISLDIPPAPFPAAARIHKMPFWTSRRSGVLFWLTFTLWAPLYVYLIARRTRSDSIVVFGAYYAAVTAPTARLRHIPCVLFVRSLVFEINRITGKPKLLCALSDLLERRGLNSATRVVVMTESMKSSILRFSQISVSKIEILPNDVPAELRRRQSNGHSVPFTVLISGIIDRRKNLTYVLQAFQALNTKEKSPEVSLIIAGDGPLVPELRRLVERDDIRGVTFAGWQNDLASLMLKSDLVIHASLHEGMPNSVLEAWSFGVPVLVGNTTELSELVHFPQLIFQLNDPLSLAAQLHALAVDNAKLQEIRELSEKRATLFRFNWEHAAREILVKSLEV